MSYIIYLMYTKTNYNIRFKRYSLFFKALENLKRYCGNSSTSYLCQRIPMGSNLSPSVWQSYINAISIDCKAESIVRQ